MIKLADIDSLESLVCFSKLIKNIINSEITLAVSDRENPNPY